jgi:aspartyl-tRNA(Asn)/glutamyl-tRNA(Gln) amidotransferase subunit B
MGTAMTFEPVIGLEVHAQLLTKTKSFCGCSTSFGARPNTNVCPVCLGLPGSLPVLNGEAVRMAVRIGLALGCTINAKSVFARKNYFYPDLPKGYQISQYDAPLCSAGKLEVGVSGATPRTIGIVRVHMEEDAGKNLHGLGGDSVVDLNRAGTPLVEIVGAPDLRSSAEAAEYLRQLRDVLMALGVNDGNLEEGSFRCDANVSIRPAGVAEYGTRAEIKNVNSFRFVEKAIDYEVARQIGVVSSGQKVVQETRRWDEASGKTHSMRSKEEAHDYRYFPEPDLPPLVVEPAFVAEQQATLEELPAARRARFAKKLGLSPLSAGVLTSHPRVAEFFERTAELCGEPVKAANFIQTEVLRDTVTAGLSASFPVAAEQVAEILALVRAGTISGKQSKEVYAAVKGTTKSPSEWVRENGLVQMSDESEIEAACRGVLERNPGQLASYRAGKTALLGFFVGQVMKQTRGSANPASVHAILTRLLAGE